MHHDLLDELSLRPLRVTDIDALTALGYGTREHTTAMVDSALDAQDRREARPMVIVRECLAPDPRSFNGIRMTELVLGVIGDIGDVWIASDGPIAIPMAAAN